jgi:hypothetical protein
MAHGTYTGADPVLRHRATAIRPHDVWAAEVLEDQLDRI